MKIQFYVLTLSFLAAFFGSGIVSAQPMIPGASKNANSEIDGTGARNMVQTCGFGSEQAKTIDIAKDEEVQDAMSDSKEASARVKEIDGLIHDLKSLIHDKEHTLTRMFGSRGSIGQSFISDVHACQEVSDNKKVFMATKEYQSVKDNATEADNLTRPKLDSWLTDKFGASGAPAGADPLAEATNDRYKACGRALGDQKQHPSDFIDASKLCPVAKTIGDGKSSDQFISSDYNASVCVTAAKDLLQNSAKLDKLQADLAEARAEAKRLKSNIAKVKRDREKALKEDAQAEKEAAADDDSGIKFTDSSLGIRGCPDGTCTGIRVIQMGANSNTDTFGNMGPWILGASLASAGIQGLVESAASRRNAALGYPTGPNMWVNPAMNAANGIANYSMYSAMQHQMQQMQQQQQMMMYGYPMSAGNSYGAIGTGAGRGAFGCGQTLGSPIYMNVGQNGNVMGPYAIVPQNYMMGQQQGGFNPMLNGMNGMIPMNNGQLFMGQNNQLQGVCVTMPCNIGALGNNPAYAGFNGMNTGFNGANMLYNNGVNPGIGVPGFNPGLYNAGASSTICLTNPAMCAGGNYGGAQGLYGANGIYGYGGTTQGMDDQRRYLMASQLISQGNGILSGGYGYGGAQSYGYAGGAPGYSLLNNGFNNPYSTGGININASIPLGTLNTGYNPYLYNSGQQGTVLGR